MQVNEEIYNITRSNTDFDYTKKITDFSVNTNIDETIVYSASTAVNLAPFTNYGCYVAWQYNSWDKITGETSGSGGVIKNFYNNDNQRVILVTNSSTSQMNSQETNIYNKRNGYDVENFPSDLNDIELIRGFKYYSVIGCIYVYYVNSVLPVSIRKTDLDTYYRDYANKKIVGVSFQLWSGSNSSRNGNGVAFANYNDYGLAKIIKTYEGTTAKYDIDTITNVLNYNPIKFDNNQNVILFGSLFVSSLSQRSYAIDTFNPLLYFNTGYANIDELEYVGGYNDANGTYLPTQINITRENILSMAATFGVLFTDKESIAKTLDLTNNANVLSDDLYFPVQESSGVWNGRYTHGNENANTPQYRDNWNNDKNAPFTNGSPSIENLNPSIYSDGETLGLITPAAAFTNMYLITAAELKALSDWLNPADDDIFEGRLDGLKFSGANPLNSITNIMQFPVDVPCSATAENVVIGKLTAPVSANKITTSTFEISGGATKPIYAFYNNWLDYEPYTQYVAWIPYCGWIELSANVITGNTVSFKYEIDVISGACTCRILVNGIQYKTINGNIATQFAIQAEDTKGYTQSVLNSVGKIGTGFAGVFAGAAVTETGVGAVAGIPLMLGSFTNAVSGFWDFVCPQENFTTVGTMTGNVSCFCPRKVNIYRFYTPVKPDNEYGNFIGYACEFSETLSNLSGFCMVSNANTDGIVATDTELKEIISILESGFYI